MLRRLVSHSVLRDHVTLQEMLRTSCYALSVVQVPKRIDSTDLLMSSVNSIEAKRIVTEVNIALLSETVRTRSRAGKEENISFAKPPVRHTKDPTRGQGYTEEAREDRYRDPCTALC